jgi:hypothetical protein
MYKFVCALFGVAMLCISGVLHADSNQTYKWDLLGNINEIQVYAAWTTASTAGDKSAVLTKYVNNKPGYLSPKYAIVIVNCANSNGDVGKQVSEVWRPVTIDKTEIHVITSQIALSNYMTENIRVIPMTLQSVHKHLCKS